MSLMPSQRDKLRSAERAAQSSETLAKAIGAHAAQLEADNAALKARVLELEGRINTPHTDEWFEAVRLEAAHQVERWGTELDAGKAPADWFWLLGYLGGKALASAIKGDVEKAKHHTISSAAVLLNWFRHLAGDSSAMRPGVAAPEERKQDSGQQQGTRVSQDNPGPAPSASIGGETTPSSPTGPAAGNVTESRDDPDRNCVVGPAAGRATSGGDGG